MAHESTRAYVLDFIPFSPLGRFSTRLLPDGESSVDKTEAGMPRSRLVLPIQPRRQNLPDNVVRSSSRVHVTAVTRVTASIAGQPSAVNNDLGSAVGKKV